MKFRVWDTKEEEYVKTGWDENNKGFVWVHLSYDGLPHRGFDDEVEEPEEGRYVVEFHLGMINADGTELDWWVGDLVQPPSVESRSCAITYNNSTAAYDLTDAYGNSWGSVTVAVGWIKVGTIHDIKDSK